MIDAHCHLNFKAFTDDYDEVIQQALSAGVTTIINTGTKISSSQWAVDLADQYDQLYAVVGIHPHHADKHEPDWQTQLEKIAKHPKVIGIGEIGLDYFRYPSNGIADLKKQRDLFIKQLELSFKLKLPLQIHSRNDDARKDVLTILTEQKQHLQPVPGMFHCMAGSLESLRKALDLGFYVGFDGNSMYQGPPPDEPLLLTELIHYAPLDRIVIETDSPFLTPPPHRNRRNEPANAPIIAAFIAEQKKVPIEQVMEQTDKNVYNIFTNLSVKSHKEIKQT